MSANEYCLLDNKREKLSSLILAKQIITIMFANCLIAQLEPQDEQFCTVLKYCKYCICPTFTHTAVQTRHLDTFDMSMFKFS